ncbi:MAG: LysR family transcriptional regulator [Geminicoccaceae bacterium]|nr:LysR family transcriptional regulator [Geminicoccaceae bacterium]
MELRTIDYFLAVSDHGSLRAAARHLGLTQPALTKAIRRLEDEFGLPLFDRRARGVTLTVYGESFRRNARALRASMVEAQAELEALRRGTAGLVRLGAGPSWLTRIVPLALRIFRERFPKVQLRVTGGHDDTLKAALRAGNLDLVVAALPDGSGEPDLERIPLMVDEYRIIADRSHPLHRKALVRPPELLDFPWILANPTTHMVQRLKVFFAGHGLPPPQATIETDMPSLKLSLMQGGPYLSFHALENLRSLGADTIEPLLVEGAGWQRKAGIMTRHGAEPNPAAQALIGIVEEVCARETDPPAVAAVA